MTTKPIRAILFDMGGTLESLYYDEATLQRGALELSKFLRRNQIDPGLSLAELQARVVSGMEGYQAWREQSEVELPPERVWTEYVFPECGLSRHRLEAAAEDLAYLHATHFQERSLRPEAPAVLRELRTRGFRLAIISNVLSRRLVPSCLAHYGIAHHFEQVVTSSEFGWRKPNRRIFDEAARLLGLAPGACGYVGDTLSRDVVGARRAGYGLAIQIRSFLTDRSDRGISDVAPDAVIHDLMQVVELVSPLAEVVAHG